MSLEVQPKHDTQEEKSTHRVYTFHMENRFSKPEKQHYPSFIGQSEITAGLLTESTYITP